MNFTKLPKISARNKSLILSGVACVGVVATGWLSARCAIEASEKEARVEKIRAYIPAALSGTATIACIGASTYISGEEIAALTLACGAWAQKFSNHQKAVHETMSLEDEDRINEAFYLKEIDRLEQELAEREHPTEDDDLCIFIDSVSPYSFKAPLEQVQEGLKEAKKRYEDNGYLYWSDVFYLANNGDTNPYNSCMGNDNSARALGWSYGMLEELFDDSNDIFDVWAQPIEGRPNAYSIEYAVWPEECFMEY